MFVKAKAKAVCVPCNKKSGTGKSAAPKPLVPPKHFIPVRFAGKAAVGVRLPGGLWAEMGRSEIVVSKSTESLPEGVIAFLNSDVRYTGLIEVVAVEPVVVAVQEPLVEVAVVEPVKVFDAVVEVPESSVEFFAAPVVTETDMPTVTESDATSDPVIAKKRGRKKK